MDRKNKAKQKENNRLKQHDKRQLTHKKTAAAMFGGGVGGGGAATPAKRTNLIANAMGKKPGTLLMRMCRVEYGAGSDVYIQLIDLIAKIKNNEIITSEARKKFDLVLGLKIPVVSEEKRKEYLDLLMKIGISKGEGAAAAAAAANEVSGAMEKFAPKDGGKINLSARSSAMEVPKSPSTQVKESTAGMLLPPTAPPPLSL